LDPDPLSILQIALPVFTPVALDYFISVLLLLLIIMNAIVSGSEVAYFSLSEEYSQDKYSSSVSITNKANTLLKKPENLLASLVLAYNLLNVTIAVLTIYLFLQDIIYLVELLHDLWCEICLCGRSYQQDKACHLRDFE
jgi:putative hemolysin